MASIESIYSVTTSVYSDEDDEEEDSSSFDKLPEYQQQIEQITWFHPELTRHHSEGLLKTVQEGVYLLRKRRANWGCYSLDVKYKHSVKHFPVTLTESGVEMGGECFDTVDSFIQHFKTNPLFGDESGSFVQCLHPYPRSVQECDVYEAVTCHFLYGQGIGSVDESLGERRNTQLSGAAKEGYIRKQGGKRKNWRTRWFVLEDDSVSYYKNHKRKNPIRRLNLKEVVYIFGDDSSKSFRIVLPWRTFYLEAPTPQNKKEWVEMLRWKIDEYQKIEKA